MVSKVLEKIIHDGIMDHLHKNNLLNTNQFGFVKHPSTKIQMMLVIDEWTKLVDHGTDVDILYLDFTKAFDKVSHSHLHKLEGLGINQTVLNWLQEFMYGRSQAVVYNCRSSTNKVQSGVPQGTVIGLVSFVSFINDLPEVVSSPICMFADDTKLFRVITDSADHHQLQTDIDNLVAW